MSQVEHAGASRGSVAFRMNRAAMSGLGPMGTPAREAYGASGVADNRFRPRLGDAMVDDQLADADDTPTCGGDACAVSLCDNPQSCSSLDDSLADGDPDLALVVTRRSFPRTGGHDGRFRYNKYISIGAVLAFRAVRGDAVVDGGPAGYVAHSGGQPGHASSNRHSRTLLGEGRSHRKRWQPEGGAQDKEIDASGFFRDCERAPRCVAKEFHAV